MCTTFYMLLVAATFASTTADDGTLSTTLSTLGPFLLLLLLGFCIYRCCKRNSANRGFRTFENDANSPRNNRPRYRRFFRRNNRNFNNQNQPSPTTHVVIQPILQVPVPSQNHSNSSATTHTVPGQPEMFAPPPAYNEGHYNPLFMAGNPYGPPQVPNVPPQVPNVPPPYVKN